ncbi:MAG: hypothetical protein AAB038_04840 [Planctomycetota bacterium]
MVRRLLIAVLGIALLVVATGCTVTSTTEAGSSARKGTIKITVGKS